MFKKLCIIMVCISFVYNTILTKEHYRKALKVVPHWYLMQVPWLSKIQTRPQQLLNRLSQSDSRAGKIHLPVKILACSSVKWLKLPYLCHAWRVKISKNFPIQDRHKTPFKTCTEVQHAWNVQFQHLKYADFKAQWKACRAVRAASVMLNNKYLQHMLSGILNISNFWSKVIISNIATKCLTVPAFSSETSEEFTS